MTERYSKQLARNMHHTSLSGVHSIRCPCRRDN